MWIILLFLGSVLGAGIVYLILLPKTKQTQQLNNEIINQNIKAEKDLALVEEKTSNLKQLCEEKYQEYHRLREDIDKERLNAEDNAKSYYEQQMNMSKQKLQHDLDTQKKSFQQAIEDYQKDYLSALQDAANNFSERISGLTENVKIQQQALELLHSQISLEASTALAAVEANKRIAEQALQDNFYRLTLSKDDLEEIEELRKCGKHLRNPEPLNKVIWKVYYENPYTSLIGRVVGPGIHCGIYKITNLANGMCYVGQSVDIANRWKQHIKRGIGAEAPTKNKLYPAMAEFGVENFSFEIVEECGKELLDAKEDYWQDFFKAKEFGYSIK